VNSSTWRAGGLAVVTAIALSGCTALVGQYKPYQRPELFFPTTAILKQHLDAQTTPEKSKEKKKLTPPAAEVEPLELILPRDLKTDDKTIQEIRVSDECPSGQLPVLQADPAAVIVTKFAAEPNSTRWFKATFDVSKAPGYVGPVEFTIISCAAANLSAREATDKGLLRTARVGVGYKRVYTNFNVWAMDDVRNEFGAQFSDTFIVADVVFQNPNDEPILVYGSSLFANVRFLASVQDVRKTLGENAISNPSSLINYEWGGVPLPDALDFVATYRPMAYSDILAIFSYQQESDPRQRAISTLKSIGEVASASAVFLTGSDYGSGVALFTGVLIPELEKQLLWDVLKHLKNLESRSLKEVEEVAGQGELRRVVFFPRRAIPHFLPPFPMYIAEITLDDLPVKTVLLNKKSTITN
jgi:hypothetical protein